MPTFYRTIFVIGESPDRVQEQSRTMGMTAHRIPIAPEALDGHGESGVLIILLPGYRQNTNWWGFVKKFKALKKEGNTEIFEVKEFVS